MISMKSLGVPFILIGGVNDNRDRGLLCRLARSLLLNYGAAEGTDAVIPCRLCTLSRRVVKQLTVNSFILSFQMTSLAVVFNAVFSHRRRGPQTTGVSMGVTMVAQTATLVDEVLLLDYDAVEGIQN